MNVVYNVQASHYIIFFITSYITLYAVMKQIYLIGYKRTPIYKTWKEFLLWMIFSVPMFFSWTVISQYEIYPQYVRTVKLDFSESKFESGFINDLIKTIKEDRTANCENKTCTINALDFKHNLNEVDIKVSNESNGDIYCGVCSSSINYDFKQGKFIANVIFK